MLTGLLSPSLARFRLWNCTSVCCWKGVAETISLLQWKCDLGPLLNFEAIFMRWRRTGRILRVGRWPNEAWYYCIKVRNGCTSHRFSRLVICSAWILCCKIEVGSSFRSWQFIEILCIMSIGNWVHSARSGKKRIQSATQTEQTLTARLQAGSIRKRSRRPPKDLIEFLIVLS